MRESPPPQLAALLEGLDLATSGQIGRMGRRVRRLAGDLPHFESVWIDALAQARILTPFQAAELNAGRGESLRVGPYLLCERLAWPQYIGSYRALRAGSTEVVRLLVASRFGDRGEAVQGRLENLATACRRLRCPQVAPITHVGSDGDRPWAAAPWLQGRTAAEWLAHNGRFPPEVVLEIVRAMLVGLVALEKAGLCHGDVSAAGLLLTEAGGVVLLQPGVRAIFRPEEGYAHADLLPEAFDYLAPERVSEGSAPDTASDVYACGCLWWHLLCGRPPLAGGDSLGKLRAAQSGAIRDVYDFAPDVPVDLAAAVSACLQGERQKRPESMARLATTLGAPTHSGRMALARCLSYPSRPLERWGIAGPTRRRPAPKTRWLTGATIGLALVAAIVGGIASGRPRRHVSLPPEEIRRQSGKQDKNTVDAAGVSVTQKRAEHAGSRAEHEDSNDLVLPSERPLELRSLEVRAGQRVGGAPGKRPRVLVPREGLGVAVDDVRFENVDFIWNQAEGPPPEGPTPAMVHLRCGRAQFRGCSFQTAQDTSAPPAAIAWSDAGDARAAALSLPSGRLQLADCTLFGLGVAIDCRRAGALAVEVSDTLHAGHGALLRLDHCPAADEPLVMNLSQVTLRAAGPLLECRYERMEDQPGEVSIQAAGCVFMPAKGMPLLLLSGAISPQKLLENLRWTGQGSLVSPGTAIAAWQRADGQQQVLDDAEFSIAGLVRGEVTFAGNSLRRPAHSRIVRWQAPLQSAEPPGVDPQSLPPDVQVDRPPSLSTPGAPAGVGRAQPSRLLGRAEPSRAQTPGEPAVAPSGGRAVTEMPTTTPGRDR